MNDVEEQILSYPHLSREKQRDIEAYVEQNPEWAPLLNDIRSVESLASHESTGPPSDPLFATYVMVRHLDRGETKSARVREAFARFEARIAEDSALQREVEAAERRLKETEAAVDPVSHFEALTEHDLEVEEEANVQAPDAAGAEPGSSSAASSSWWDVIGGLPRGVPRGVAVAVVLVALYGALYGISLTTQSTLDRLAAMEVSDQVVDNYASARMRSAAPEASSAADERYLEALSILEKARISTLGLFPRYDTDRLDRAQKRLGAVLEKAEPNSFLALEAHFYLGKIALAQENVDAARTHFKTVVQREGRQTQEAYEILKTLQQEYSGTQP
ncbi:tetratricopeptide repeat protein [Salinibacter ruber]|uniref:tetratricopeptide repeat protein n=1 Tax=Salinibacter ruber TaxID=146919 RepID=UPI002168F6B6|nr:hypothetical protein [Salinibacter ruber]MCS3685377.1 anti-sigma-K factor RskA [Salinibacter ruber]